MSAPGGWVKTDRAVVGVGEWYLAATTADLESELRRRELERDRVAAISASVDAALMEGLARGQSG